MKEKQKYMVGFLDGYMDKHKLEYGFKYFWLLEKAEKKAEKSWKKYKNQKLTWKIK